jgi:hypothetical protein
VSGSYPPPTKESIFFYDLHFYEVHWYEERYLYEHPATVHAFGIDRRFMFNNETVENVWDLLFVGAFAGKYIHVIETHLYKHTCSVCVK